MRQLTSWLACAACVVCLLAPSPAYSEMLARPDTTMASILEINKDYLKVLGHERDTDPSEFRWGDTILFDMDNQDHLQQVVDLGHFGCKLYDREAVFLSVLYESEVQGHIFLFACAIP